MSDQTSDCILAAPARHARLPLDAGATVALAQNADAAATPLASAQTHDELWEEVGSLTVIVPLPNDPERVRQLQETLARIDHDIRHLRSALASVPRLHVARWVVLPERVRGCGARTQPSLVMWTVHDGPRDAHLQDLVREAPGILDAIYAPCGVGYPAGGTPAEVVRFLAAHAAHGRVASFVGTAGISVDTVLLQTQLVRELVTHIRALREKQPGLSNEHIFLNACEFIRTGIADPTLRAFAARRPRTPRLRNLYVDLIGTVLRSRITLSVLAVVVATAIGLGMWWRIPGEPGAVLAFGSLYLAGLIGLAVLLIIGFGFALRFAEKREARQWIPASNRELDEHHAMLRERDNEGAGMNRVTIVTDLKPGLVRQVTLRFVLWLIAFRAGRNFAGTLEGVETIHFAQWRIVDGGRRLLFMSNYDGQALDYFREFGENLAPGVNAIWGNTEGMPPTTAVVGNGSRNLEDFENAARVHQIPTDAWYCGYPNRRYTTAAINDNWRIHRLLHASPTPPRVEEWMALLARYGA